MDSKNRILSVLNDLPPDHIPLTTWCFGFQADPSLRWARQGIERSFWYSLRMEHIHNLPQVWDLEDDFRRVLAWQSLGIDDLLDVSVPWSCDPDVTWEDTRISAGEENDHPLASRLYHTPNGSLRHTVRLTGEVTAPGWVVQPENVPLFEDYNIPRGVTHLVTHPEDVRPIHHLYAPPDAAAQKWFRQRMTEIREFTVEHPVAVQAWSAFGMDGVVWLTGVQNALLLAMDAPEAFHELVETVFQADIARTELALSDPGIDIIVQRGWYSSTDFWSPRLFDKYVFPYLAELAALTHRHGRKIAYVMTTGVHKLGLRLADAGVDLLYFADPVQDRIDLTWAKEQLSPRMTLAGGINALTLATCDRERIRREAQTAVEILGSSNRFILHPLDAIFPDTPWEGMKMLIETWKELI